MPRQLLIVTIICGFCSLAAAQTDSRMVTKPWPEGVWGETDDHPLYQAQSDVKGTDSKAQLFWWDSTGRFRFSKSDRNALDIGSRWVTMSLDANAADLPDNLDEVSLAAGLHFGQWGGGDV